MAIGALVLCSCATLLGDARAWDLATTTDTIDSYRQFLSQYPDSEHVPEAQSRLEHLVEEAAWQTARIAHDVEAYEVFAREHLRSAHAAEASRRAAAMARDLEAWGEAEAMCTVAGYHRFLERHPGSPYGPNAMSRIVDLEVDEIMGGRHGDLPTAGRVGVGDNGFYSIVNVENDTDYGLLLRYSGPDSFRVNLWPGEKGSLELLNGDYRVTASVVGTSIGDYAGRETYDGGTYGVLYYVEDIGSRVFSPPRSSRPRTYTSAGPWPRKRSLPDYLKWAE